MSGGTPGPWSFDGDWHRLPTIFGADGKTVVALIDKRSLRTATAETSSNARLIATAPELLEALGKLRKALDLIDPSRVLQYATTMDLMRKCADAAITKATGAAA